MSSKIIPLKEMSSSNKLNHSILNSQVVAVTEVMKYNETMYAPFTPYLSFVRYYTDVVENIISICDYFKYSLTTCMVAIQYFCRVCQTISVRSQDYNSVSVVCVMLAAKYEEKTKSVPTYRDIIVFIPNEFESAQQLCQWERTILQALDWHLNCVTAGHFLSQFFAEACFNISDMQHGKVIQLKDILTIKEKARSILQSLLGWYSINSLQPSVVAACVIALAQEQCNLDHIWTQQWEAICGVMKCDIVTLINYIHTHCTFLFSNNVMNPKQVEYV